MDSQHIKGRSPMTDHRQPEHNHPDHLSDTQPLSASNKTRPQRATDNAPRVIKANTPRSTRPVTPAHEVQRVRPTSQHPRTARQRRQARAERNNALYFPWWSILVMLFTVVAAAAAIIVIVIGLGNNPPSVTPEPVILIITAPPEAYLQSSLQTAPTTSADTGSLTGNNPPSSLALDGPTLPAVQFTPTPVPLAVGVTAAVTGVDANQLNVRDNPGVNGTNILFRADEGTQFTIVGGPQQADGLTWWQIQSAQDATLRGWAASQYLEVVIQQS